MGACRRAGWLEAICIRDAAASLALGYCRQLSCASRWQIDAIHEISHMRKPSIAVLLMLAVSAHAAPAAPCDRAGLLAKFSQAPALGAAPEFPAKLDTQLKRFVLFDSPLAMDGYKYDGLVDLGATRAWIIRSGGIAGAVEWFGPVAVEPAKYLGCPDRPASPATKRPPSSSESGGQIKT